VSSGNTSANGVFESLYITDGEGVATVTATNEGCQGENPQTATASTQISVGGWTGTINMSFYHAVGDIYESFSDNIVIDFVITSADVGFYGDGTGSHSVNIVPGECSVTGITAPDFPAMVVGTVNGEYFDFVVMPNSQPEFPLSFTLLCNEEQITIPVYSPLLGTIMGLDMQCHVERVDGATDSGSGSSDFGEDMPIDWSFEVVLHQGGN